MTSDGWSRVKEIAGACLDMSSDRRLAYIREACSDHSELSAEVQSLLAAHDSLGDFLATSVLEDTDSEIPSARAGAYRICERIAEGGMGTVYRAVRTADFNKLAAVKLVKRGMDTNAILERFRNERQILARLDHPNIARLIDGGATLDGRPYLVMEYIDGLALDQYCDRHKLTITKRLELFRAICATVQYAHQNLVIHRDLKPSNILVTADGTPKLLDFGIAKILGPEALDEAAVRTLTMVRLLTPEYASPEQLRGETMTTASDVYSLGVVLYELLTGRRPYRVLSHNPEAVARAVTGAAAEKPSAAVTRQEKSTGGSGQVSTAPSQSSFDTREGSPEKLRRRLRGDLDNIALMALRKEPQRRYASVEQFSEDIRRHLAGLPVIARTDTFLYRTSKFVKRHTAGVSAAALVALSLIAGMGLTLREARIAHVERARAEKRFNDVRQLANSLIYDIHDSIKDLPGSTPVRKIIVDRALVYLNSLVRESMGDLGLQRELATAYERVGLVQGHYLENNLGDTKGSLASYEKALSLRRLIDSRSRDWRDRLALAQSHRFFADLLEVTGERQRARNSMDQAIAISEALSRDHPNDPQVLFELALGYDKSSDIAHRDDPGEVFRRLEDVKKALSIYEAALRVTPGDVRILDRYAINLGKIGQYLVDSDPKAALPYYERELEIERKLTLRSNAASYATGVARAYAQLTNTYEYIGDTKREFENAAKALAIYQDLNRKDPQDASSKQRLAIAYVNTALASARLGRFKSSLDDWSTGMAMMREIVVSAPENMPQRHYLASILGAGGIIFLCAHKPEAALKQFAAAHAIFRSLRDAGAATLFDFAGLAACSEKMGEASAITGNFREAADDYRQALATAEPLISVEHQTPDYFHGELNALYVVADAFSGLGDLSLKKGQQAGQTPASRKTNWGEARSWYVKSLQTWRRIAHPNHTEGNSFDVGDPALVLKRLQRCDAALAGRSSHAVGGSGPSSRKAPRA